MRTKIQFKVARIAKRKAELDDELKKETELERNSQVKIARISKRKAELDDELKKETELERNSQVKIARMSKRQAELDDELKKQTELEIVIEMKILAFEKQLEFYKNNNIDIERIVKRINDKTLFYNEVKYYVLSNYNVMTYPKICEQLYANRESIDISRVSVMELLIEHLSEKFYIYKLDTFDNI